MPKISLRAILANASSLRLTLSDHSGSFRNSSDLTTPALTSIPRAISGDFTLSPLFSEGAVLQRDYPIVVWGEAAPGETVSVSLGERAAQTYAGSDGRWKATLDALGAGGPYVLSARTTSGKTLTRGNILLGDVWLCSGQSNMEMSFNWDVKDKDAEVAAANYPNIRLLQMPHRLAWSPQTSFDARWQECRPDTVRSFSAAAYIFGRELQQQTGVSIGLVQATWSGSIAQPWVSAAGLQTLGEYGVALAQNPETAFLDKLNRWWRDKDAGTRADWSGLSFDDSSWNTAALPGNWSVAGVTEPVGVIWLRLRVNVPANMAGRDLKWRAGEINGDDTAFWNSKLVGQNVGSSARTYLVPGALVEAGSNVLALRISGAESSGISGSMELERADGVGAPIAINGLWKYRVSLTPNKAATQPRAGAFATPRDSNLAATYNGLIAPLQPLSLKGVLWYQGESNAFQFARYMPLLNALISDWRAGFENPNLPFCIAQIASYGAPDDAPTDSDWVNLQWVQNRVAFKVPNCGLVVLNDVGDPDEIHAPNKQDVGKRLALLALRDLYGKSIEASGPTLQRFTIEDNELRLTFANAQGGLRLEGDANHVFALSNGGRFEWATPRIEGDEIVLSAPGLSNPKAARFAWSGTPRATLYNGANLPASLFATDK